MSVNPDAVLAQVRVAKALTPPAVSEQVLGRDPTCVGCPPHLRPGQKCIDPVTGQEGEVIAYARATVPGPVPEAG